jgi:hypothetical protein
MKHAEKLTQYVGAEWGDIRRAQVKVGLINLCKGLFSLNVHEE